MLQEGTVMSLRGLGGDWRVGSLIGEGGQGSVFRLDPVNRETAGDGSTMTAPEALAIKWYHERSANRHQREAIARLIARGTPGSMFLWPLALVEHSGVDGFGYVMPLRADEHRPIGELLLGRVEASPRLALTLCIGLAHAFLLLHVEGLCYRDISFGNVFFDPATGTPMICDNDNVGVDGDSFSAVLGTRKFMAPEVIRGEAMPSAQSDLHSLAVLLFYVLARHHPLIGRLESRWRGKNGEEEMLGTHPLFIFDPSDDRNRPDEATQPAPIARWARLPRSLKVLFEQSFTTGLHDPSRRVRESVWRATLTQLLDSLHRCGWCGEENLTEGGASTRCVACRRHLDPPVRLRSERCTLTLNDGTVLTAHHVHHNYDLATGIGRVVHDETRNRWGLRNLSAGAWRLERVGRAPIIVQPGQAASLLRDAELIIDRTRFVFEASR